MPSIKREKIEEHQYSNIEVPLGYGEDAGDGPDAESSLDANDPREGTSFAVGRADHASGTTGSPMLPVNRPDGPDS